MANRKATACANSNIAFIKYWGSRDQTLRLPLNDSLSMNLDALVAETTVQFDDRLSEDRITIGESELSDVARLRIIAHLDQVRREARFESRARVVSRLNFPASTGLASSAAGFAALSLAATRAAGLELSETALSVLARQGSGSACRSAHTISAFWHRTGSDRSSSAARATSSARGR